jgi:isopenicillin N synthase-like dioxygenase
MATATVMTERVEAWTGARQYLQSRLQARTSDLGDDSTFGIPVIDIGPSFSDNLEARQKVAYAVRTACLSSGFFYITNHGIDPAASAAILHEAQRLLRDTPRELKEQIHIQHSSQGYGWEPSDSTTLAGDKESKEAFNWSYEDDLDLSGGDGEYVQLDGSKARNVNQWPGDDMLPGFYEGIQKYYSQALTLARNLCGIFALSLGLHEDYFAQMITHPSANSRLMYYPPNQSSPATKDVGLGAHSDYQTFTILLCTSTPGLEILSPSGQWIQAPTVKDGLIVNIGDMLMRWTNRLYKSTVHRVVNRTNEERYSVPLFFGINNESIVEVSLV